ncbi:MAG: YdcF family protein, partial [Candidatus Berkelbacteria bacterium]|nr:YdcF family protein [Candidatus Berkelbacteria bacterium]
MKGIIIVLGSFNDEKGNINYIAKSRLNAGIKKLKEKDSYKLLLTGGFGRHFNTTNNPHAYYAKKYCLKNGIMPENILDFVESGNTVEDAYFSKPIIDKYRPEEVTIVSSDFHLPRVKYIFNKIFFGRKLSFIGSHDNIPKEPLMKILDHEKEALVRIKK